MSERVDKWLWAVRLFKSRSLATSACRAGAVEVNGQAAKPARPLQVGERVLVRQGIVLRQLVVVGFPKTRVGAKLVPEYCDDQTPASEYAKAKEQTVQHLLAREKGSGRPTKRDRRMLDRLFD